MLISPLLLCLLCRLAILQNTLKPSIDDAVLLIFAADHGFTKSNPGVSAYPRQVSTSVFHCIANGDAASAVLCKENNCRLTLVDVGLEAPIKSGRVITEKNSHVTIAEHGYFEALKGSRDFLQGPAMSEMDLLLMYETGRKVMEETIKGRCRPAELAICIGEVIQ